MQVYYLPAMTNDAYTGMSGFLVDPDQSIPTRMYKDYGLIEDQPGKYTPGGNDCRHIAGTNFRINYMNPGIWLTGSWVSTYTRYGDGPEFQLFKQSGTNRRVSASALLGGDFTYDGSSYYDRIRDRHIVTWGCDPRGRQAYWRCTQLVYNTRKGITEVYFYWTIVTLNWSNGYYSGSMYQYLSELAGTSFVVNDILSEENSLSVDAKLGDEMKIDLSNLTPDTTTWGKGTIRHIEGSAYDFTVADPNITDTLDGYYKDFCKFVDQYWLRWVKYPDGWGPREHYPDLGEMCVEAAQSIRVDHVNMAALIKDMYSTPTDIISMIDDVSLNDIHQYTTWYLSGKYGPRLTVADLKTLRQNAAEMKNANVEHCYTTRRFDFADVTGRTWSGVCRVNFDCEWSKFNELWRVCDEAGLRFTGADAWDLVPYSFVIDWFVDIGGWLEAKEAEKFYERMSTFNSWLSSTVSTVWKSEDAVVAGDVRFYSRDNIITQGTKASLDYSPDFGDHLIEIGALYVQKH